MDGRTGSATQMNTPAPYSGPARRSIAPQTQAVYGEVGRSHFSPATTGAHRSAPHAPPAHVLARPNQTIFGDEYFVDDLTRRVTNWLYETGVAKWEDVEVEVKLGMIVGRGPPSQRPSRMNWPVQCETIIADTDNVYFVSDMSSELHSRFNAALNRRVEMRDPAKNNGVQYKGPSIAYRHFTELDSFHHVNNQRIRVTRLRNRKDADDPTPRAMEKVRLANLDVYCPNYGLDYRISVSREIATPLPPHDSHPRDHRLKDRLSYTCPPYSIDLTAVASYQHVSDIPPDGTPRFIASSYELEIELQNPFAVFATGMEPIGPNGTPRWVMGTQEPSGSGMKNVYESVRGLLDQARLFARRAVMPGIGGPLDSKCNQNNEAGVRGVDNHHNEPLNGMIGESQDGSIGPDPKERKLSEQDRILRELWVNGGAAFLPDGEDNEQEGHDDLAI
ncbi:mRNA-capping enzyme subunit beta [Gonapodya sp. JEL0774]|nr:mRNA-capping enzyme subunit beta [Gonapodya sp. JEL0774]